MLIVYWIRFMADVSADINDFELKDIKGTKLAHLNVRSLVNKVADLQNWLSSNPLTC